MRPVRLRLCPPPRSPIQTEISRGRANSAELVGFRAGALANRVARPRYRQTAPFERVSATVGLCFRETGFCGAETAASKRPVTFNRFVSRDKVPARKPTLSALFARHQEISVCMGLRGGAGRCPTLRWIKYLRKVRVETDAFKRNKDFASTRTPLSLIPESALPPKADIG